MYIKRKFILTFGLELSELPFSRAMVIATMKLYIVNYNKITIANAQS